MRLRALRHPILLLAAAALVWLAVAAPGLAGGLRLVLATVAFFCLLASALLALRWWMWSVGRRLGFSYFLIGVVPFPILAALLALTAYVGAGIFASHIYRTGVRDLVGEAQRAAYGALERWQGTAPPPAPGGDAGGPALAYYRDGIRVGGSALAPEAWPAWLVAPDRTSAGIVRSPYVALPNGHPALAVTAVAADRDGHRRAVLALIDHEVEEQLAERTGLWVRLLRSDDPQKRSTIRLSIAGRTFSLVPVGAPDSNPRQAEQEELQRNRFFATGETASTWRTRPWIWWGELTRDFRDLQTGEPDAEYLTASLNTSPAALLRQLFSGSPEVNTAILAALLVVSSLLGSIYLIALAMAITIMVGLSRAVNRISRATEAVRSGDFSVRIPETRSDQIGELQRTFNQMTAGLQDAVATRAHQEALESELAVARRLQESLLPVRLPASDALDFSTLFQPSAAIGGDYFDLLRLDEERVAVVVADVSGHGLPSGLRMAMLKAALSILVEEGRGPEEIFRRLDTMVRGERPRYFVTCTIAVVDLVHGRVEITNAGHPPTYHLRTDGAVEEILLPGSPLGMLASDYGRRTLELASGDVLVWLSDGLVEAQDASGEPFGYTRLQEALTGPAASAAVVRDRLLTAIAAHTGGATADDDRTLVILRFRGESEGTAAGPAVSER